MGEDGTLDPLQRRARLEAELVGESSAGVPVDLERLRLPAGAVQREHQLPAQPLAQWVPADELLELLDDRVMPAQGEVGLDPLLERREVQLLEPGDVVLGKRLVGELGERRAAPEGESNPECLGSLVGIVGGECLAALLEQRPEAVEVELSRRDAELVAVPAGQQDPFADAVERFSKP